MTATDWRTRARCLSEDPEIFFPIGNGITTAKRICAVCPVAAECLDDALAAGPYLTGIYGGTTEHERRKILRTPDTVYPPETRQRACDLWTAHRGGYSADGACARQIARTLGVETAATILGWVRDAGIADPLKCRARTAEEREAAIDDYLRTRHEYPTLSAALDAVASAHGTVRSALRGWLIDAGHIEPGPRMPGRPRGRKAVSGA